MFINEHAYGTSGGSVKRHVFLPENGWAKLAGSAL
jgi:hypothetical protein